MASDETYAKTLNDFEESIHFDELNGSYSISDKVKALCDGKLCMNAPLIMMVHPDRREENKLQTTFTELIPQSWLELFAVFIKKFKNHPLYKYIAKKLDWYKLHCMVVKGVRAILHKYGCIYKGNPCIPHQCFSIPQDLLKIALISTQKPKQYVDAKVE